MSSPEFTVAAPRTDGTGSERGTSLVETIVAIGVLGIVMSAAMIYITTSWRFSELNRDKVFAYEKAVSILTEMQAFLETTGVEAAADLDSFDDGITVNPTLTITKSAADPTLFVAPNDPASGNISAIGQWRWSRQISVAPFPGVTSRDLRIVTVRIFRGQDGVDPTVDPGTKYAEVSSVLRTIADAFPTTQVYDIYLMSVENVPGWWVFMDAIKPFIQTTIDDLQARNPGLQFRTHWITKLGFGRSPWYRPYWNTVNDSNAAVPYSYFYPAKMPPMVTNVISSAYYYVPDALQGWARTEVTATNPTGELNPYSTTLTTTDPLGNLVPNPAYNPFPYTLADQWNHCMRSVDEEAWFHLRQLYGSTVKDSVGSEDDAVPTWHLLLDRMKSSPSLYRNAIFINLHGELLPMPPMRSYSDPAKDPVPALAAMVPADNFYSVNLDPTTWTGGHPGVRVVTHPAQQRYIRVPGSPATSDDVQLRVYAYLEDPQDLTAPDILSDPIEIQIYGVNLASRVEQAGNWVDLGSSLIGGPVTGDRNTWRFASFRQSFAAPTAVGTGFLRVEALKGGAKTFPQNNPVLPQEPYSWGTPMALGLGEFAVNHHFPSWTTLAPFNAVIPVPTAGSYTISSTTRPEGFLAGWFTPGGWVHNGGEPVIRCGYVPPEMDPEKAGYTILRLYNTPLKTPLLAANTGLQANMAVAASNYRLYGRDYIPTTCEAANDFSQDLTNAVATNEKNTARWRITIRKAALGLPIKVRNARKGTWVDISAPDPDHPADPGNSDHWPLTVTTRIGSRVQDYNNDGRVDPGNPSDCEESFLTRAWGVPANFNANCFTTMDVVDRAMFPGAMRPYVGPADVVGPSSHTYSGGLRVRVPDGLEVPPLSGVRAGIAGGLPCYGFSHRADDLSTTYAWWTNLVTDVPISEQAQFLGDPRHCPYKDFKNAVVNFPNAYNWFFDNFRNATDGNQAARWPGFDTVRIQNTVSDTADGWMGRYEVDVPRLFKTLRESLAQANMLWTTLTGFSYYYLGIGNEIGYDSANGYANSIPVNGAPWGTSTATLGNEQSITNGGPGGTWGSGVKVMRSVASNVWLRDGVGAAMSYWWGASWLGELYPDSAYGQWVRDGNLPSGNVAGTSYQQVLRSAILRNQTNVATRPISLPFGTRFADAAFERRTNTEGCTSFFNIGTSAPHSTFHHTFQSSVENGFLTATVGGGVDLANSYSFPLPTRTKISRPFDINLNTAGSIPTEFDYAEYSGTRFQAFRTMRLYDHDNGQIGSGLIVNRDTTDATGARAAFILVNGIDRATESGSAFISRYSMVSLIHSFLVSGFVNAAVGVTAADRIAQLPRVSVVAPTVLSQLTNPASIAAKWHVEWKRWDGLPYTNQYAPAFTENEANLSYVPMWSSDNGTTWVSMVDNATVIQPGVRPTDPTVILIDTVPAGDENYLWNTPVATFPRASYLVRIDCYRGTNYLHYAYHQEKIYIDR